LQLFAAWLLQRVQLFAAWLTAAAAVICCLVRAAWTWCRWLPSAAWWLPADLVAQLLPVAAWSRSCCLAVFVFVIQGCRCL